MRQKKKYTHRNINNLEMFVIISELSYVQRGGFIL